MLSSSVRISERQFPEIHKLLLEACDILDYDRIPELYISQNPVMNAGAIGVDEHFIVLNSSLIERLSPEEILSVIGHELGHCASNHGLYMTLLFIILNMTFMLVKIPYSELIIGGIKLALLEWYRKAELSADRAGLLVVQDAEVAFNLLMKMSGGTTKYKMNLDEFIKQAEEYENSGDVADSVHKFLNILGQSHPFPVLRINELNKWIKSGAYDKIISGNYMMRGEEKDDVFDDMNDAAKQYENDFNTSNDPFKDVVNQITNGFDDFKNNVEDFFKKLM